MRKSLPIILLGLLFVAGFTKTEAQNVPLVVVSPFEDSLWTLDTANSFAVTSGLAVTATQGCTGINGMSVQPKTGAFYINYKPSSGARRLGTIDPTTGIITDIGSLGDNFAGITWVADTLFGVTGDGATQSESLFRINHTTAATTLIRTLGNGDDGESISWNPTDNMIYHCSGLGTPNNDEIFEKIAVGSPWSITSVTLSGYDYSEIFSMTYLDNNTFLVTDINANFILLTASGVAVNTGFSGPNDMRGTDFPERFIYADSIPSALCDGDTVMLHSLPADSFQWYRNGVAIAGATSQDFAATSGGTYNCVSWLSSVSDSSLWRVDINMNALPNVSISPGPSTYYCQGDSVELTGSSGGTSQWYMNGSMIPGATSSSYFASMPGNYNLTKTNMNGCTDSAAVGITVMEAPQLAVSGAGSICEGASTTLSVPAGAMNYQWYNNGNLIPGADSSSFSVNMGGSYTVTATWSSVCTDSLANGFSVLVDSLPDASYAQSADTVWVGQGVNFTNSSANGVGNDWDFGDGNTSNQVSPSHAYLSTGTYTVSLIVSDSCGSDTATSTVVVTDSPVGINPMTDLLANFAGFPNPFEGSVTLVVEMRQAADGRLVVYDLMGKEIAVIREGEFTAGNSKFTWNANTAPAGMYLVRLETDKGVAMLRLHSMK